ncbi:hypothetical protein NQD34_013286 [Periophthalmus magnuspinnatus]|nr:hypothetical protein NQD34_013286 [Periophthalmus magnuspinnatus]
MRVLIEHTINFYQNEHYSAPYPRGETPTLSNSYGIWGTNWWHEKNHKITLWPWVIFHGWPPGVQRLPKKKKKKKSVLIECTKNCFQNEHYSAPYPRGETPTLFNSYEIWAINWWHEENQKITLWPWVIFHGWPTRGAMN